MLYRSTTLQNSFYLKFGESEIYFGREQGLLILQGEYKFEDQRLISPVEIEE